MVKVLLRHSKIDVSSKDDSNFGKTPLFQAVSFGLLVQVKVLLQILHPNIDVNSTDDVGRTPLSFAAEKGNLEIVLAHH